MAQSSASAGSLDQPLDALDHESTKARILTAAIRLFADRGYESTSVRQIVEAAGVTKPVLYYYYKNKEDLFHQIVQNSTEQFLASLEEICSSEFDSPEQRFREINDLYLQAAETSPELVRFVHALAFSGLYKYVYDFEQMWNRTLSCVEKVMASAAERGLIRTDIASRSLALHLVGISVNTMRNIAFCTDPERELALNYDPIQIMLDGIKPRDEGRC